MSLNMDRLLFEVRDKAKKVCILVTLVPQKLTFKKDILLQTKVNNSNPTF